jgi:PAS domain-containing protein
VRLTETFRDGFAADGSTHGSVWDLIADAEQRLLLNGVLEGRLLRVDLALPTATGSVTVQAEAVVDMAVTRHALLTVCSAAPDPGRRAGAEALLGDPSVDDSQAIVWIKDLDGRYLRVNRRYSEALGIDDARIRGKTDAELSPAAVVDGRRPGEHGGDDAEPVQLEYTVEAAGGRTALTVLRFPVRDLDGAPVAVCRVAAPATEAGIARSEAERLLRIERWARLSTAAIRAELIEEWQRPSSHRPAPSSRQSVRRG